ncbi:hypothetical protein [Roseateles sp.]|uniref:hypothetical protein n=1 Tax=Roseateles sp. TaxID=1971397 RepID=UPI003BA89611
MKYDDTHVTEAQLSELDADAFDMAQLVDESGRPARYVFSTHPQLRAAHGAPRGARWQRLVVHVDDATDGVTFNRVWVALRIKPSEVPF